MSDHASGPRAFADPVIDITDMFAFPSPQQPGILVLVLDVFPFAGTSALFSDAVDYRFRVRPIKLDATGETGVPFTISDKEHTFSCRFNVPEKRDAEGKLVQEGSSTTSTGCLVEFRVNDERGGCSQGLRAYAGVRMDPFFFDGVKALQTLVTRKLSFEAKGNSTMFRQNVLSIVLEIDVAGILGTDAGTLFAVVGETVTAGSLTVRLERFGRPDVKNLLILPKDFDTLNRDIELRDVYNDEDGFQLRPAYASALRSRMNANLSFWDGLDGRTDWTPNARGDHPLTELFLADFMVVDISKPYAENTYLEIERMALKGMPHQTSGGRTLNDDAVDTFLTFIINAANGPRISDGVDQPTVPASRTFPYLAAPEPNPPTPKAPAIISK